MVEEAEVKSDVKVGNVRRQIAHKVRVGHILGGRYVKEEGWLPNYIEIGSIKASRVNIIGVILSMNTEDSGVSFQNIMIDDGTGNISLRSFDQDTKYDVSVGDLVMVVGRPREYGAERYLLPEIVRKIDRGWAEVRNLELKNLDIEPLAVDDSVPLSEPIVQATPSTHPVQDPHIAIEEAVNEVPITMGDIHSESQKPSQEASTKTAEETVSNPCDKLIELIKRLDNGGGASFEDLVKNGSVENTEKLVRKLLEEGDIFEIKPGMYKVLE